MKLFCYALNSSPLVLKPASATRAWMDEFPARHAYRCLPLSIANTYGWEILSPCDFEVSWNGGPEAKDITFVALDNYGKIDHLINSNFTHGIVTFHTSYLFRTQPGWNLMAGGPLNCPKNGIAPLNGVVETDWLPYPFTMNWKFTQPGTVRWVKDEPLCLVFPIAQGILEQFTPEVHDLKANAELKLEYDAWRERREEFMGKFRSGDPLTVKQAWQKFYFLGKSAKTGESVPSHVGKLRLSQIIDKRE